MAHIAVLPLDRTGQAATNLVTDETHTLMQGSKRLLILKYGSFFKDSLVIKDDQNNALTESQYSLMDFYQDASLYGLPVFNTIVITDPAIGSNIKVTYQALGGIYSVHKSELLEWFNEFLVTGQTADWSEIEEKPKRYKAADHKQHSKDLYGAEYLSEALDHLKQSLSQNASTSLLDLAKELDDRLKNLKQEALLKANTRVIEKFNQQFGSNFRPSNLSQVSNLGLMQTQEALLISQNGYKHDESKIQNYSSLFSFADFIQALSQRWVSKSRTRIDSDTPFYMDPSKAALMSMHAGAISLLKPKSLAASKALDYTEGIYPVDIEHDEEFAIVKISSYDSHYGGIWLGFSLTTNKTYVLKLSLDTCPTQLEWERVLVNGDLDKLTELAQNHIQDTKNPHRTTKDKVSLSKVENLPVVTTEEILAGNGVRKYMTLDTLIYHAQKELANIKPPKIVDGKPDPNYRPMDQDMIVFSTCKSCLNEPETHSKGMLVKTWCEGTDKFARYTDGKGGYEDKVLQLDSDDCKFIDKPKEGTVLATYCKNTSKVARIADGKGDSFTVVVEVNSKDCGYFVPPPAGTKLAEYCQGNNEMIRYADGTGGAYDVVHAVDSARCGSWPKGTVNPPSNYTPNPGGSGSSQQKLTLSIIPSIFQPGTTVNEYLTLTGFTPNSSIPITAGFQTQYYNNGQDYINPQIAGNVQTDPNGTGTFTRSYVYDENVYKVMQVPPGVTEIFTNGFYRANGIESNRVSNMLKFPSNQVTNPVTPTPSPNPTPQPSPNPQPEYTKAASFVDSGVGSTVVYLKYEAGQMYVVRADDMSVLAIRNIGTGSVYNYSYYDAYQRPLAINQFPAVMYANGRYTPVGGVSMSEHDFNQITRIVRSRIGSGGDFGDRAP